MKQHLLLSVLLLGVACSHSKFNHSSGRNPSWVEGIRSGEESLRVVNGSRVLYRRILSQQNESSDETCARVLKLVQDDVSNESVVGVSVPYTLEYLLFDPGTKECAVTISVGTDLLAKISGIKSMKEKYESEKNEINKRYEQELSRRRILEDSIKDLQAFILKNKHLVDKFKHLSGEVEVVRRSIAGNREKVRNIFLTGMSRRQFQQLTGEVPNVAMHGVDLCYRQFNTFRSSPHGNIHACWNGGYGKEFLSGICDVRSGECFTRDP